MIKWYHYEIIIYFFQIARIRIRIHGLLDPDWDFWLYPDPDSIEYWFETLTWWPCVRLQKEDGLAPVAYVQSGCDTPLGQRLQPVRNICMEFRDEFFVLMSYRHNRCSDVRQFFFNYGCFLFSIKIQFSEKLNFFRP